MKTCVVYYLATLTFYWQISTSAGKPTQNGNSTYTSEIITSIEQKSSPITNQSTLTDELIMQQTENAKKIVSDHNQQSAIDYPIVAKIEPDYSEEAKKQIEKFSIEELKIKCQQLSKLYQINTNVSNKSTNINTANLVTNIQSRPVNHKPYDPQRRPIYIQPQPIYKPNYSTTPRPNGFYITQSTITQRPIQKTPIKYIRLEPVILQKTILSDGRTVYYWHRSLPTAVEIADDTFQNNQAFVSPEQSYPSYYNYYSQSVSTPYKTPYVYGNLPYKYPYTSNSYIQNYYTSTEDSSEGTKTTESSTTSTTEQSSYGYGFGSFLPFYSYKQEPTTTTTTEPTTSPTLEPTTEKPKPDNLLYAQQLKFIVPVPYENVNGGTNTVVKNPWNFDQYAYNPKELQPNTVNVQVPYNPTFHMVRAFVLPNTASKLNDEINS